MLSVLWNLAAFIIALGVLITVHEFGHFWVARRCGIRVERFSIGFGKALWRRMDKQGTEFVIALIPLGGYVKMLDERVEAVAPEMRHYAFNNKTVGQRAAVIAAGYERLRVICSTYLLCGIMDTLASSLRGLGYSVLPMVVSLVGSCLLRLVWIATIFQLNRTPFMLYISYPISWVLTAAVHLACLLVVRHKMRQRGQTLQAA